MGYLVSITFKVLRGPCMNDKLSRVSVYHHKSPFLRIGFRLTFVCSRIHDTRSRSRSRSLWRRSLLNHGSAQTQICSVLWGLSIAVSFSRWTEFNGTKQIPCAWYVNNTAWSLRQQEQVYIRISRTHSGQYRNSWQNGIIYQQSVLFDRDVNFANLRHTGASSLTCWFNRLKPVLPIKPRAKRLLLTD